MLPRGVLLDQVVAGLGGEDCVVSGLGYLTRDLFARTAQMRERSFYCLGSMGSVAPLALGLSLARPRVRVFALEGDGSLLMNLGCLVTLRRYGSARVRLVVCDNGCYESTGGQPSQPPGLHLEEVCRAVGLPTAVATRLEEVREFVAATPAVDLPAVLVAKVALGAAAPRSTDPPALIAQRFARWVARR